MILLIFLWEIIAFSVCVAATCNPLTTNGCAAIPGLVSSSYSIDFTQEKSLPPEWILADASNVTFGSNGIQFNFNKRKDAPYIWTNFYVAYGTIDVVMQVASGTGIITSAVMFSDDADEIDFEFSGSNFGAGSNTGKAQTNVFGKGITGNYDRGTLQNTSPPPQTSFHTYTINWTPEKVNWIIDGVTKYTLQNNGQTTGNYQFPQTPSRLHIGVWDAGDPDTAAGTRAWAGGYTDYSKCPYVAYVKSVKITTPYPCKAWKYPNDFSGSWSDVKCTNEDIASSSTASTTVSSVQPQSTEAKYTVVAGDNGYLIAGKLGCTFDQLSAANPGVNWNFLNIGQQLNNPNANSSVAASSSNSTEPLANQASASSAPSNSNLPLAMGRPSSTTSCKTTSLITYLNPDGIDISTVCLQDKTTTSTSNIAAGTSMTCDNDNCLNSMLSPQFVTAALAFCSSSTKATAQATPTFLNGCGGNVSRLKSACSCLSSKYTTTNTSLTTSTIASASTSKLISASITLSTSAVSKTSSSNAGWSGWDSGTGSNRGWFAWSRKSRRGRRGVKRSEDE